MLCDQDVRYALSNFSSEAIARIESDWPQIKDAIERSFRFINAIGISGDRLSSHNALLPVAYFLSHAPGLTLLGTSKFEQSNARAIRRWLANTLLMSVFGGSSDRTLTLARATIVAAQDQRSFPEYELYRSLSSGNRLTQIDERAIEEILDLRYRTTRTFLALTLLYHDEAAAPTQDWQVDHIIPEAHASRRVLMGLNLPESRIRQIESAAKRIGNLQLLASSENLAKSDLPFDAWITSRSDAYRFRHLIPDAPELRSATNLPEFVSLRERLMREKLLALSSPGRA